jgi:hypothetical protein
MPLRVSILGLAAVLLAGCGHPADPVAGGGPAAPRPVAPGPVAAGSVAPGAVVPVPAGPVARLPDAHPARTTPSPHPTPAATPNCPYPASGFDCRMQQRLAAADAYQRGRPGVTGIVVRDRQTGAVWRNGYAGTMVWTASTIKLAMTVDLFLRDRAHTITLSAGDRDLIAQMLHSSDDNAADTLWFRYAGADHMAFNRAFPKYGMTSLVPQRGFTEYYPYWGFQKCTANDLDRLVNYVLTALPADLRGYIVGQLRTVAPNQQWGVWGAGPANLPGNKDGWSLEQGGWVMNSVGFVGPGQRYTLAMMNSLRGQGGYDDGRLTDTRIAALLFG